jgi:hypothetical protein
MIADEGWQQSLDYQVAMKYDSVKVLPIQLSGKPG